jgi:hypothetical protein
MALLHHNIVSSRSAMSLLHNDTIRSRSAIPLAGARYMALLHNAPRITANHSRESHRDATVKATAFEALFALYSY